MNPQTITVTFDKVVQEKLDAIANCLAGIAQTQAQQDVSWGLPITATAEEFVGEYLSYPRAELISRLNGIRDAVDEGRRSEALALINGWIGAIKTAERDGEW